MLKGVRNRRKDREEGFTLIELLVVVLILGILMAIAIPTFLSLTSGAKTNAAEADLNTATADEAAYETTYGDFDGTTNTPSAADNIQVGTAGSATNPPGMLGTDPGLNWTAASTTPLAGSAGKKVVWVVLVSVNAIVLGSAGQNGNYYWVSDNLGLLTYAYSAAATVPTTATASWANSWKAAATAGAIT